MPCRSSHCCNGWQIYCTRKSVLKNCEVNYIFPSLMIGPMPCSCPWSPATTLAPLCSTLSGWHHSSCMALFSERDTIIKKQCTKCVAVSPSSAHILGMQNLQTHRSKPYKPSYGYANQLWNLENHFLYQARVKPIVPGKCLHG